MTLALFDLWRADGGILLEGENPPTERERTWGICQLRSCDPEEIARHVRNLAKAGYFEGLGEGYDVIDFALWLGNLRGSEGGS